MTTFQEIQNLLQTGLLKTVTDGDCFFDTLAKVAGLYTTRGWRHLLGRALLEKEVFTQKEYRNYLFYHEWADYKTVYESVRFLNRPFCVIQCEYPNSVMLIRPEKVEWTNILYLVYDNGNHFTSFLNPVTPAVLVQRLKLMERVDMHEEEEGCVVTHGSLFDLTHDTITEEDRLRYVKIYDKTEDIRMDIEAYKFKVKSKHKSKPKAKSKPRQPIPFSDALKAVQEEQDYRNAILLQREENYDATVRLHEEMERAIETQRQAQAADEIRRAKNLDTQIWDAKNLDTQIRDAKNLDTQIRDAENLDTQIRVEKIRDTIRKTHKARVLKSRRTRSIR